MRVHSGGVVVSEGAPGSLAASEEAITLADEMGTIAAVRRLNTFDSSWTRWSEIDADAVFGNNSDLESQPDRDIPRAHARLYTPLADRHHAPRALQQGLQKREAGLTRGVGSYVRPLVQGARL